MVARLQKEGAKGSLLAAYEGRQQHSLKTPDEAAAAYAYVVPITGRPAPPTGGSFQKFSLVDPSIRTVLVSNTVVQSTK